MSAAASPPRALAPAAAAAPDAPVLVFDSGLGGLSVLRAIAAALPGAPFVYATDHAGLPYGEKSEAEIATRVSALLGRLVERVRPRLAVIACNTASTIALAHVRAALDTPLVGTVPAIKPAAAASASRVIGVLGTAATVRQPYLDRLIADHAADCTIIRHGAPALVLAAEARMRGEAFDPAVYRDAIAGLTDQPHGDRIDVIVLACTHFPLIAEALAAACPRPISLVDGSAGIARRVVSLTAGQAWPAKPVCRVISNGGTDAVTQAWGAFAALGFTRCDPL